MWSCRSRTTGWIVSQNALGRRQETPWTSCRSITNLTRINKQSQSYFTSHLLYGRIKSENLFTQSSVCTVGGHSQREYSAQKSVSRNLSLCWTCCTQTHTQLWIAGHKWLWDCFTNYMYGVSQHPESEWALIHIKAVCGKIKPLI